MAIASSFITLMDYTDGVSLVTHIQSNQPMTSLYEPELKTLNPSWASTPLQLTPVVNKVGEGSVIANVNSPAWFYRLSTETSFTNVSGKDGFAINNSTRVLSVSKDLMLNNVHQVDFKFTGIYHDEILKMDVDVEIVTTFSRVSNGAGFVVARAYPTKGTQFKNGTEPSELDITADLIRSGKVDDVGLTYQWQSSTDGVTWANVSASTSTSKTLKTTPDMVTNGFTAFKCLITDTEDGSSTKGSVFTTEAVSLTDVSDSTYCIIESTNGNFFNVKTTTSTILICRVYSNGTEVDPTGATYKYTWTATDKDGNAITDFAPTAAQHGSVTNTTNKKAIRVSSDTFDVKANFFCSVSR